MIIPKTSAVDAGFIVKVAGIDPTGPPNSTTNRCVKFDLNRQSLWTEYATLANKRIECPMTLTQTGHLIVFGGCRVVQQVAQLSTDMVFSTEWIDVLNPNAAWQPLLANPEPRAYHSTATPDESSKILVAGTQHNDDTDPNNPELNYSFPNARIFTPPYLLTGTPRPIINSISSGEVVHYGQNFTLNYTLPPQPDRPAGMGAPPTQLLRVTLLRLSAQTHGFDQDQRLVNCTFTQGGGYVSVVPPLNAYVAPPGDYMLTIVDSQGVPSMSKFINLGN